MSVKLSIGTVQFGQKYGISNKQGIVPFDTVREILLLARNSGVDTLDTAIVYGSEECLGNVGIEGWRVVTKIPEVDMKNYDPRKFIYREFNNSLSRLNVANVTGLMLHRPMQLLEDNGSYIWDSINEIKANKKVEKIGFSIYDPKELDQLWTSGFKPDIVQVPFNILDQRIKKSGWLNKLKINNIEIHARSVFLQGLLLMNRNNRPEKFNRWENIWKKLEKWSIENNTTILEIALTFTLKEKNIDRVIVGVETLEQMEEILSISKMIDKMGCHNNLEKFSTEDVDLINPSNWNSL